MPLQAVPDINILLKSSLNESVLLKWVQFKWLMCLFIYFLDQYRHFSHPTMQPPEGKFPKIFNFEIDFKSKNISIQLVRKKKFNDQWLNFSENNIFLPKERECPGRRKNRVSY